MRWNDEEIRDYKDRIDVISNIPSNKIDVPNLNNLTDEQMEEFERRHLLELAEQVKRYDFNEQQVVAENLDPFILYNALGQWMTAARETMDRGAHLFQQGGQNGNI